MNDRPASPPAPTPAPTSASPAASAIQDAARKVRQGELLRVGQLAERSGRSVRALHLYEELGLLSPAGRTQGGFRLYDESALLRLQWIDRLQDLGFSLKDAADFLADLRHEQSGPLAMQTLRAFYRAKLEQTRTTLERLRQLEVELDQSLGWLDGCRTCDEHTPRLTCPSCTSHPQAELAPPSLVAAVHDPS